MTTTNSVVHHVLASTAGTPHHSLGCLSPKCLIETSLSLTSPYPQLHKALKKGCMSSIPALAKSRTAINDTVNALTMAFSAPHSANVGIGNSFISMNLTSGNY